MSYFEETAPEEWDLLEAIKTNLSEKSFKSYQQLFDSIRNNLERFDNETATDWKQNWTRITQNFLLKLSPTTSESFSHQSTVHGDVHSAYTTKRKNGDDSGEDLNIKKQKHLETSGVLSEEQPVSSQESQPSLYTTDTDSTEVNFDRMRPYFFFNEDNINRICFNFRNECLKQELVYKDLPDIKKMAVNHVYLVDQGTTTSTIHVQSDFFSQFELNESYPSLTREDIVAITLINQNLNIHCKEKARDIALEHLTKDNKNPVAKIMYNFCDNAESVYSKDESLFIGRALDPFLNVIFPAGGTMTRDGHFTFLIGNSDLKPDVKYSAKIGSNIFDFLIFEVKCPNSVAKDDLSKMSLELQLMINRMIDNNVNKPVVYGVVGQGRVMNKVLQRANG
ncbi:hypothetical protein HPULCUR_008917 [Helicostylum pulchrum]|uniref:Uncharacterized protein n=1 Tax=Helicostylum pulchrum TaxID=562976 RepID=A0ABP9Y9Z7_9FUNG